jgi:hypothetical protein
MIKYVFTGLLIFTLSVALGQQYLVVQKYGKVKNFKYQTGDEIMLEIKNGAFNLTGEITQLSDSSLTINSYVEIKYENITKVLRPRRYFTKLSKLFFIRGGIAYVTIVGINGIINNDSPLIDEQTLTISATMVAIGLIMKPFYIRKLDLTKKWHLKMLNFDMIPETDGI